MSRKMFVLFSVFFVAGCYDGDVNPNLEHVYKSCDPEDMNLRFCSSDDGCAYDEICVYNKALTESCGYTVVHCLVGCTTNPDSCKEPRYNDETGQWLEPRLDRKCYPNEGVNMCGPDPAYELPDKGGGCPDCEVLQVKFDGCPDGTSIYFMYSNPEKSKVAANGQWVEFDCGDLNWSWENSFATNCTDWKSGGNLKILQSNMVCQAIKKKPPARPPGRAARHKPGKDVLSLQGSLLGACLFSFKRFIFIYKFLIK